MRGKPLALYGAIVVLALLADQWVKQIVDARLVYHEQVDVLPFLALFRTHNTGMAFSMLSWVGDRGLAVIVLLVIAFVTYLAVRTNPAHVLARAGFALVIGGALGNLVDRVMHGYVIDYVLFHTPVWSFAIFNLADAFITVGAGLVILQEFLAWRGEKDGNETDL